MLLRRFFRVLPVLVGVAAVAVTWTLVVQARNYKATPGPPANHERGAGYTHWANHHPQDLATLQGRFYPPRAAPREHG